MALKRALRPGGVSTGLIKGESSTEAGVGLVPGYSASGQDVWLPKATHFGPGLVLSAVGARCGKVFQADGAWSVVANTVVLTPQPGHDARFLWYLTNDENFWEKGGTAQPYVRVPDTLARKVWLPALNRQRAIADYLDSETVRIDALIEKKRQLIELLEERRSAFIGRAVTVGLDDARTTSTGNEFAPTVREGWTLNRLRHVVEQIIDTAHKTAPVVDDGEYLVVRTANVKSGTLVLDGARYTDKAAWTEWTARGVPSAGDVIFTREAPAGEACLVPEGTALCIGQRTVLLRPSQSMIDGEWIVHSIYSGAAQRFIEVLAKSTTVAHINMSDIPDIPVVLPPLEEQKSVLSTVRREVSRLVGLKEKLRDQIDLLHERRQVLITAAVTGELGISGLAA